MLLKVCVWSAAEVRKSCGLRKLLKTECLLASAGKRPSLSFQPIGESLQSTTYEEEVPVVPPPHLPSGQMSTSGTSSVLLDGFAEFITRRIQRYADHASSIWIHIKGQHYAKCQNPLLHCKMFEVFTSNLRNLEGICNDDHLYTESGQTSLCSFSALSKPIFANIHVVLLRVFKKSITALKSTCQQNVCQHFANLSEIMIPQHFPNFESRSSHFGPSIFSRNLFVRIFSKSVLQNLFYL